MDSGGPDLALSRHVDQNSLGLLSSTPFQSLRGFRNGRKTCIALDLRRRRPARHCDRHRHHSERNGRAAGARTASARRHELDRNLRGRCLREHWLRLCADRIFRNEDRQPGSSAGPRFCFVCSIFWLRWWRSVLSLRSRALPHSGPDHAPSASRFRSSGRYWAPN